MFLEGEHHMRTSLRRALAGVAATTLACSALFLAGATPASAEDSSVCPQASSTRLLTANDGQYKVWLYQATNGTSYVCFASTDIVDGVFVVETGLSGTLVPTLSPDVSADCNSYFNLQDPVDAMLQWQWTSFTPPMYFCLGVNGTAVGFTLTGPSGSANPDVDLWLDSGSTAAWLYCQSIDTCDYWYEGPFHVV